jgi:hypothetical protein
VPSHDSDDRWYAGMAERARERREQDLLREQPESDRDGLRLVRDGVFSAWVPARLLADPLPAGVPDVPRYWCTMCGLPDAPVAGTLCPRCGSEWWRWYGRIADLVAAASGGVAAPPDGECSDCYQWRRYPPGQEHFGWQWWMICDNGRLGYGTCQHEHHRDEIWLAAAGC